MEREVPPLPGYPEPYGLLCAVLQDATSDWRSELWVPDLPAEVVTWRIRPGGPSIGALMLHLIIAELYWFEMVALEAEISEEDKRELMWNEIDADSCTWPDPPQQPLSWYYALHHRYRQRTLEAIKRWPGPETGKLGGGGHMCSMPWILGHVIQHETYHGGQIVMIHDQWKCLHEPKGTSPSEVSG